MHASYFQASRLARPTLTLALVTLLAALQSPSSSCQAAALSRSQRQTVTSELASGLTNTGTSFNSLYSDPLYQELQQQQQLNVLNMPYDDYGAYPRPAARYPGPANQMGKRYDTPLAPTTGGWSNTGGWSGFGMGKGGRAAGRQPGKSGIKY